MFKECGSFTLEFMEKSGHLTWLSASDTCPPIIKQFPYSSIFIGVFLTV